MHQPSSHPRRQACRSRTQPANQILPLRVACAPLAAHSVATLATHYAGVLEELEDKPRIPAAEAIRDARSQLRCAQSVRTPETTKPTPPNGSPANNAVGDAGLEPATSALSRRIWAV